MRQTQLHIRKVLLPFSGLYGLVVWFRNKLFDWGILRSEEFPVPVISVGNITVGGTGKTPHVEYLVRLLRKDYKVAVLSRGYKRKSRGFMLANRQSTSREIGDEPYQIWRKFPDILVAVDKKRVRGIQRLLALDKAKRPDIILLDDAFQHRYVKPSFSILLTDINRIIYEDVLLPAGRLREPASNKFRANMVVVTKCPKELNPIDYRIISKHLSLFPYQSLFFTSWEYGNLRGVFREARLPSLTLEELKAGNTSVLLFSGIANPQQLTDTLTPYVAPLEVLSYPDHYHFSASDLQKIKSTFDRMPAANKIIITTEKDASRLIGRKDIDESIKARLYYLPIEVVFTQNDSEGFDTKIIKHVRTVKTNRFLD